MQKMLHITAYGLKILKNILVFSNYLNLYKINEWYLSFIMYGHHLKLCAYHDKSTSHLQKVKLKLENLLQIKIQAYFPAESLSELKTKEIKKMPAKHNQTKKASQPKTS